MAFINQIDKTMEQTKVYTVIAIDATEYNDVFRHVEAVFTTYEKAERHVKEFFKNSKNIEREIVETELDMFQEEVEKKQHYYLVKGFVENDCYQMEVDRTSDIIFKEEIDELVVLEKEDAAAPTISYYCFASSVEEAFDKFKILLVKYFEKHDINVPLTVPKYNQNPSYY